MKNARIVPTMICTLALALVLVVGADARGPGMGGGGMSGMSPEKHGAMQKMHEEFAEATEGLRKQLFAKEAALMAELYAETPDDRRIQTLTGEVNAIQAKIYAARVALQKQMAQEGIMPGGRHGGMGGGMGMMGGGMMGGGMSCPMMGGSGGMHHGMRHGAGPAPPAEEGDHSGHAPAAQ